MLEASAPASQFVGSKDQTGIMMERAGRENSKINWTSLFLSADDCTRSLHGLVRLASEPTHGGRMHLNRAPDQKRKGLQRGRKGGREEGKPASQCK